MYIYILLSLLVLNQTLYLLELHQRFLSFTIELTCRLINKVILFLTLKGRMCLNRIMNEGNFTFDGLVEQNFFLHFSHVLQQFVVESCHLFNLLAICPKLLVYLAPI